MNAERFNPSEMRNPHFEAVQLQKMRLTALMMEYMQAFGASNPDKMNKSVMDMREVLMFLSEMAYKTRVANDQKKK